MKVIIDKYDLNVLRKVRRLFYFFGFSFFLSAFSNIEFLKLALLCLNVALIFTPKVMWLFVNIVEIMINATTIKKSRSDLKMNEDELKEKRT